jgi:hypothetical protein
MGICPQGWKTSKALEVAAFLGQEPSPEANGYGVGP